MNRKVVPAVLIYIRREDRTLMIQRPSGLWNGVGGKCELDESVLETACRETREESGLVIPPEQMCPLGVIQLPNFKADRNEDWIIFIFIAEFDQKWGEPLSQCDEGTLHWVPTDQIEALRLWSGDRHFLSFVVRMQPFIGTIWYQNSDVVQYWVQPFYLPAK